MGICRRSDGARARRNSISRRADLGACAPAHSMARAASLDVHGTVSKGVCMRTARQRLLLACALSAALALLTLQEGTLNAQSPRPMGLVDLLNLPQLGDPQLSPDGRDVAFTRSVSDWKSG